LRRGFSGSYSTRRAASTEAWRRWPPLAMAPLSRRIRSRSDLLVGFLETGHAAGAGRPSASSQVWRRTGIGRRTQSRRA
jgi:hypothetical protein